MGYVKTDETLDLILISAKPVPIKNESFSNLLNGDWFVQTIGRQAEKIEINARCRYSVVKILRDYADTKDGVEIGFLDFVKRGSIIGQVDYSFTVPGPDPMCDVNFELAVIPDV